MKTTKRSHDHILVGLGGLKEHGKDAVADYLAEAYGYHAMGMSQPLNDVLLKLNPWIPDMSAAPAQALTRYQDIYAALGYTKAKAIPEVRRLLQVLGTDIGREMISPTVWTGIAGNTAQEHLETQSVAITGIRFKNELKMITELYGVSIWIDRPGHTTEEDSHASENGVQKEDFDLVITNDGTLEDLYRKVDALLALPVIQRYSCSQAAARIRDWPVYDH